jgi:glutathione-regulated potassium-efflux system ancillary protein KefF
MKTLVIVSHPYPENSTVIKALQASLEGKSDITVRNLETLYGNHIDGFDVEAEKAAYAGADRVVYMFPIHWFNITPMLKAYLNVVWQYGWAFGPDGEALKGKEMLVVTCAGASAETYSAEGLVQCTMEDILSPMKACALYVGMTYAEPLYLNDSMGIAPERLDAFKAQLAERLSA